MDDFLIPTLNDSRNEWCERLTYILIPHINEGITLNEKGEVITYSSLNPFRYFVEIFISDVSGEAAKDHFVDNYLKVIDKWDGVIKN